MEPTINDIVNSMSVKQKTVLYDILGSILDGESVTSYILNRCYNEYNYTEDMITVTEYLVDKARNERRKLIKVTRK